MMRRFISLCAGVMLGVFSTFAARAELVIEITRGLNDAVPIAVVPFGSSGNSKPSLDIAEVVSNDLSRSGRFAPLDRRDMIEQPTSGEQIQFADWRLLKSNYILVGKTVSTTADHYDVQFELFN